MNKSLVAAAAVAVVVAGGAMWWLSNPANQSQGPSLAMSSVEKPADPVPAMVLGQAEAPVTIVEYASFTCPHCKAFHDDVLPQIKANYIDTGKAKLEFREFYLNQFDLAAATIAQCGGPMRYFGIVDIFYNEQSEWLGGGDPQTAAANLLKIAKRAGMTDEQARACMSDEKLRERLVGTFQWHATEDAVTGTPTFLIDGQKYANMGYADFAKILDEKLAAKN